MATKAVFIDALGTTVRLLPPWERLDRSLTAGLSKEAVRGAFETEMAHYAAHAHEAHDAESLAALRADCAAILSEELGREVGTEAMMDAIGFEAYADAPGTLAELRARGLAVVCVSNWDFELPEVLERVGLLGFVHEAVSSAGAGARKPDPAIFERALELVGAERAEVVHVGDTDDDVDGARAAGVGAIRIDRTGSGGDIRSLAELPAMLIGEAATRE